MVNKNKNVVNNSNMSNGENQPPRPPNTIKAIPLDGQNNGQPFFVPVVRDDIRIASLANQLEQAKETIGHLKTELGKYEASGKVINTTYDIIRDEKPANEVNVYRIRLNAEFEEIRREISYYQGICRSELDMRIGASFMKDMIAHLAMTCFGISKEEIFAKIDRAGDATDSVTLGIRAIRNLLRQFQNKVAECHPKFPPADQYAACVKQLASSMNLAEFEMFFVCFTGEIHTDARVYHDLVSNQNFSDKLSQFQLAFVFAVEVCCDYPRLLAKPATHLIDLMTSIRQGNDITGAVRRFMDELSADEMGRPAVNETETPLSDTCCSVLEFCAEHGSDGVSAKALMSRIHETSKRRLNKTILKPMRDCGYLKFTCKNPHASNQRYLITPAGVAVLRKARPGRTYPEPSRADSGAVPTDPNGKTE